MLKKENYFNLYDKLKFKMLRVNLEIIVLFLMFIYLLKFSFLIFPLYSLIKSVKIKRHFFNIFYIMAFILGFSFIMYGNYYIYELQTYGYSLVLSIRMLFLIDTLESFINIYKYNYQFTVFIFFIVLIPIKILFEKVVQSIIFVDFEIKNNKTNYYNKLTGNTSKDTFTFSESKIVIILNLDLLILFQPWKKDSEFIEPEDLETELDLLNVKNNEDNNKNQKTKTINEILGED